MQSQETFKFLEDNIFQNHQSSIQITKQDKITAPLETIESCH